MAREFLLMAIIFVVGAMLAFFIYPDKQERLKQSNTLPPGAAQTEYMEVD
jgi:hypothetical protein